MDFRHIDHALRKELRKHENQLRFQTVRKRYPVLHHYNTPFSVLSVLDDRTNGAYPEKEILTRALIKEQQRSPHSLWSGILVKSYLPMLCHLRNRIGGHVLSHDDLDQLIYFSFLEVIQKFPLDKWMRYTSVRLQQQTARSVFKYLHNEEEFQDQIADLELDKLPEKYLESRSFGELWPPGTREHDKPIQLAAWFRKCTHGVIDHDMCELIIDTFIFGENLRQYVKRNELGSHNSTEEQNYQSIKRKRTRALAALRKILLERVSPIDPPKAL